MELGEFVEPQPAPVHRPGGASMHDVAAALHLLRRDQGLSKYGTLLQAANGRDATVDEVQELLDGLVYRIQATLERRALADATAEFVSRMRGHSGLGDSAASVEDDWDELMAPDALAARADDLARTLIGQARADGDPADGQAGQAGPERLERLERLQSIEAAALEWAADGCDGGGKAAQTLLDLLAPSFKTTSPASGSRGSGRRAAEPEQVLSRRQHELMMVVAEQRTALSAALALLSSVGAVRPGRSRPTDSSPTDVAAWDTRMQIVAALAEQARSILAQGVEGHVSSTRPFGPSELVDLTASFRDG